MPLQEVHPGDARELKDIADNIAKSHRILIVTGAGISTSCGIPDFRSKDGLYNMIPENGLLTPPPSEPSTPSRKRKAAQLEQAETPSRKRQELDTEDEEPPSSQSSTSSRVNRRQSGSPASRMSGQDLFHARVFQRADTTQIFNQFLAGFKQKLKDEVKHTSKTHKFIRVLRDGGRLMRCYTQNIDGLEEREGLCVDLARGKGNKRRFMKKHYESPRPDHIRDTDFDGGCEVVQLHGELNKLRCTVCSIEEEWTVEASEILLEGAAPKCNTCNEKSELRQATGKRGLTVGTLRPNIVLYGEEHPQNTLLSPLVPYDIASGPEILIIMGTSLKVFGMQKIIRDFAKAIHSKKNGRVIFVNRTRPAESVWEGVIDDFVEMDCDDWVEDLKARRPGLWLRQGELDLKETKTAGKKKRKSDSIEADTAVADVSKKVKIKHNQHISVDIPQRKAPVKKPTTGSTTVPSTSPPTHFQTKTPSKAKPSRATKWRNAPPPKEFKALLSPLAKSRRPASSPLSEPSSPGLQHDISSPTTQRRPIPPPYSPFTPPFSPLTPSRFHSKTPTPLRIHQDIADIEVDLHVEDNTTDPQSTSNSNLNPNPDPLTTTTIPSTILKSTPNHNHNRTRTHNLNLNLNTRLLAAQTDGAFDNDAEDADLSAKLWGGGASPGVKKSLVARLRDGVTRTRAGVGFC